jgi:signal peptidase I
MPNSQGPLSTDKTKNPWIEGGTTIGLSAILALGLRQYVAEARFIPTGSMEPTIEIDDRVIVDKVSYRLNLPQRGDIVVFTPPETTALCSGTAPKPGDSYIKRLIAIPGDQVMIKQGQVLVNGKPIVESYSKESAQSDYGLVTVPRQSYFVLGDNLNNSCDSRIWGFVPASNLIGKASMRYWPLNHIGNIAPKD